MEIILPGTNTEEQGQNKTTGNAKTPSTWQSELSAGLLHQAYAFLAIDTRRSRQLRAADEAIQIMQRLPARSPQIYKQVR
jgi:hypothetical protein